MKCRSWLNATRGYMCMFMCICAQVGGVLERERLCVRESCMCVYVRCLCVICVWCVYMMCVCIFVVCMCVACVPMCEYKHACGGQRTALDV